MDIDTPILDEIRALASRKPSVKAPAFAWFSQSMTARIDIDDKDALYVVFDYERGRVTQSTST